MFALTWLAVNTGRADLPEGVTWGQIYGSPSWTPRSSRTPWSESSSVLAGIWGALVLRKVLPRAAP